MRHAHSLTTLFSRIRRGAALSAVGVGCVAGFAAGARAADYVPGEIVVGYTTAPSPQVMRSIDRRAQVRTAPSPSPQPKVRLVRVAGHVSVAQAIRKLRSDPRVAYAVPDYIAHADSFTPWVPDDRGRSKTSGGWMQLQWNFLGDAGVDAVPAWANLIAAGHPGARGVTVAILDTGVAYRDWRQYRESPDFSGTKFVAPYDFVADNRYPLDREGHGTFVAGLVAETTNNGYALTGLAYDASIMPVRVLDADGTGDAETIARGIRYAATHDAQVINLSLEFSLDVTSSDIPEVIDAIEFAHEHGVVVVAASGNEGVQQLAYPARSPDVISVGATTRDRCLAAYSNGGPGLDVVAPGGGEDSSVVSDPNCHPDQPLPTIYQMTILNPSDPRHFGLPEGVYGTSMSSPHVAAAAAMVIASGVLGPRPTPAQILARLEHTAQHLGGSWPNQMYGYGLIDVGAATTPITAQGSSPSDG